MLAFLLRLLGLTRPYRVRLILGIFFGVIAGVMEAAVVGAVYIVFAVIFPQSGREEIGRFIGRLGEHLPGLAAGLQRQLDQLAAQPTVGSVVVFVSLIPAVMLIRGVVTYLNAYLLNWVAVRTLADLRTRLFDHLLHLPARMLQRFGTGELMSRLTNDVAALHHALASAFVSLIKDPIALVAFLVGLLTAFRSLTVTALVVFPVCIVPVVIYARKLRRAIEQLQNDAAEVSQTMHDGLSGLWLVKAYNLEGLMVEDFRRRLVGYNSRWMRATRASELPGPMLEFGGTIGLALLLGTVALRPGAQASAASFLAFVLAIILLYQRIRSLIRLQNLLIQAQAASGRVFDLLALTSDLKDPPHPRPTQAEGAEIRFEGVSFAYDDKPVLKDVSLTIPSGKMVALVGPSGAGKTTLAMLVPRFFDPTRGRILLGGTDLRDLAMKDLRDRIAVVSQDVVVFRDTIRRNIELGRPGATQAEIEDAARHAYAHDFIVAKPDGYDTIVGERGAALSGGQRQRLAIARALLRNAPILILDEATSALDTESERFVQAAFERLSQGRTTLCIAHRLSTVQRADLIVVLDHGGIVAQGNHNELLAQPGLYRRLYELQFET